jgi:hypothetical protein
LFVENNFDVIWTWWQAKCIVFFEIGYLVYNKQISYNIQNFYRNIFNTIPERVYLMKKRRTLRNFLKAFRYPENHRRRRFVRLKLGSLRRIKRRGRKTLRIALQKFITKPIQKAKSTRNISTLDIEGEDIEEDISENDGFFYGPHNTEYNQLFSMNFKNFFYRTHLKTLPQLKFVHYLRRDNKYSIPSYGWRFKRKKQWQDWKEFDTGSRRKRKRAQRTLFKPVGSDLVHLFHIGAWNKFDYLIMN